MPFKLGPLEIVLILVLVLIVFGVGKLPQVGAAIGKSIKAFKEGQSPEAEEEAEVLAKRAKRKPAKQVKKAARKPAAAEE